MIAGKEKDVNMDIYNDRNNSSFRFCNREYCNREGEHVGAGKRRLLTAVFQKDQGLEFSV